MLDDYLISIMNDWLVSTDCAHFFFLVHVSRSQIQILAAALFHADVFLSSASLRCSIAIKASLRFDLEGALY